MATSAISTVEALKNVREMVLSEKSGKEERINILIDETFASPSDEEYSRLNSLFSLWVIQIPRQG